MLFVAKVAATLAVLLASYEYFRTRWLLAGRPSHREFGRRLGLFVTLLAAAAAALLWVVWAY